MSAGCVLGGLLCLMDFFYYIDLICRRNFATAVATKGQWKQTKSAIALWKPSGAHFCYLIFIGSYSLVCVGFPQ